MAQAQLHVGPTLPPDARFRRQTGTRGGRGDAGMRLGVWMPTAMPFGRGEASFSIGCDSLLAQCAGAVVAGPRRAGGGVGKPTFC
jgi:hypothetical protein